MLDSSGEVVVKYVYDAWGNNAVVNAGGNIVTSGIGVLNPFRYRGYYWDRELGLYYLQTRYYDPELGRFISADDVNYLDPSSITGLNLYAYCGNNPVMYIDPTGHEAITAMLIILGIILGGTLAFEIAYSNGARGAELFGWTLLGMALGALAGWAAPYIGTFLGTSFPLVTLTLASGQAVTISVTGAELVAASVGLGILFSKIDMHGEPNSSIQNGGSFGKYDEHGNLMFRTDTDHKHFIKEFQDYFQPHTHHFKWDLVKGIWRYIETILPW